MAGEKRGKDVVMILSVVLILFIISACAGTSPSSPSTAEVEPTGSNEAGKAVATSEQPSLLPSRNEEEKAAESSQQEIKIDEDNQDEQEVQKEIDKTIAGRFRCWSYNVQGAGESCTSPPLILNADGTYSMSSEQGTYTVEGDIIFLSESKIRGPGTILEDGYQIRFEYDYNGWHHTLTYSRVDEGTVPPATEGQQFLQVTLTMIFPYDAGAINTVQLIAQGETAPAGETLAYAVGEREDNTLEAVFRKDGTKSGILSGKVYEVYVSSGFSPWSIGTIDLQQVNEDTSLTIYAPELTPE